jgi:hypothetical protein
MEIEEQKDCDLDMIFEDETEVVSLQEMDVDEQTVASISPEPMLTQEDELEEIKKKRTERRKTFLKDLEVCDLLDLRDPQCVSEYATDIYAWMKEEEVRFLINKSFLDTT